MSADSSEILIEFDDPSHREVVRRVQRARDLGMALRELQSDYPGLNFLVDVRATGRTRLSVVMAGSEGMAILWLDHPLRTRGDSNRAGEIYVWDGAGVDMPAREFVPLPTLTQAIENWIERGQWPTTLRWLPEE